MADTTTKLISDLDFTRIKANLSAFIANNSDFTDYNFSGSALSTLTDILAYNTHYNAVYLNMALNENFIDTAQTRSSVVSLAKNLGYTPRSKKSSIAELSFTIDSSDPEGTTITLEKTDYFSSTVDGVTYVWYPIQTVTATADVDGIYTFDGVKVREGSTVSIRYSSLGEVSQKFYVNNFDIDLDSLEVAVLESTSQSDASKVTYSLISDITTLTPESLIYYLFETTDRRYEISFGDGVLGKKLTSGNVVIISYQTSSGDLSNGASDFQLATQIDGRFDNGDVIYYNVVDSYGGDQEENLDSIRLSALQNFRTQGRAVTTEDYKFFIERDYPLAESISVWGGQDNDPPIYGKVFISFKPRGDFFLSAAAKQEILDNVIKTKNIVTVIPEIVDPEYTYIQVSSSVKFDSARTLMTAAEIKAEVLSSISDYATNTLAKFGTSFSYSKFIGVIDNTDPSIIGNITSISLRKNITVNLNQSVQYSINFQNTVHPGSVTSKYPFYANFDGTLGSPTDPLFIDDDEMGNIRIYKVVGAGADSQKIILNYKAGTVDYGTGKVTVTLKPSQVNADNTLDIVAKPADFSIGDVNSYRNTILVMVDSDVSVNVREL